MKFLDVAILFLFCLAFLSPLRIFALEKITPLKKLLRLHHYTGVIFSLFVLLHMYLKIQPYTGIINSAGDLFVLLFDPSDLVFFSGSLATVVLTTLLLLSFWKMNQAKIWLRLHRLFLLLFPLVLIHLILARNSLSASYSYWSNFLIYSFYFLALVGVLLFYLYPKWIQNYNEFKILKIEKIDKNSLILDLKLFSGLKTNTKSHWQSGQWGFFCFECKGHCGVSQSHHPFTVIDVQKGILRIWIRALGQDTTKIQTMEMGSLGRVNGPYGDFIRLIENKDNQLWIAGGMGIAPFLGLIHNPRFAPKQGQKIDLFYFTKTAPLPSEKITSLPGMEIFASYPSVKKHFFADPNLKGLSKEQILFLLPDLHQRKIALAGPPGMIRQWLKLLKSMGIKRQQIECDDFLFGP